MTNLFWFLMGFASALVVAKIILSYLQIETRWRDGYLWERDPETDRCRKFKTVHNPDYDRQRAAADVDQMRKNYR